MHENPSIPSVEGMDTVEASSSVLCLPSEEGINQLDESTKVSNSNSCKYLTYFMLDVIRSPEEEAQEILSPPSSSFSSVRCVVAGTPISDYLKSKTKSDRRAHQCASNHSSRVWRFNEGSKWESQ